MTTLHLTLSKSQPDVHKGSVWFTLDRVLGLSVQMPIKACTKEQLDDLVEQFRQQVEDQCR